MQFIDRTRVPPPTPFQDQSARVEREEFLRVLLESSERRSQSTLSSRRFELTHDEIHAALGQLFNGKCAFCERREAFSAKLFRPAGEAEPLAKSEFAHLYYAWLRTDWNNVYPVCGECAVNARNQFPVDKLERGTLPTPEEFTAFMNENYGLWRWPHRDRRQLLDPCDDRTFVSHLSFSLSGDVKAFSKKGAQTIAVFNLDRQKLVESRAAAFHSNVELLMSELRRGITPNVFNFALLEHGGAWSLILRRFCDNVGRRLDQTFRFRADKIAADIERIWNSPIGRQAIEAAFIDIREPVSRTTIARPASRGQLRRLTGIQVRNFKALESVDLLLPAAIMRDHNAGRDSEAAALLVLGENAAGKSSILEAVALALTDARTRATIGRSPASFILDPTLMGSEGRPAPTSANVTLNFEDGSDVKFTISDRFEETGTTDSLPPVFAYGAFRQYAGQSPKRRSKSHVGTLFRSDVLLANPEEWLLSLPEDEFAMVVRALQRILLIEGDLEVVRRDPHNRRCLIITSIGDGFAEGVIGTPMKVVSSGFRSILAMVCDVLAGLLAIQPASERKSFAELEAVILIDEVEAHLHPRWKMQIMSALRRALPKATIIATTHDPLCLRGMHDQEVVVLNRALRSEGDDPDGPAVFVETILALPNVENLTVEQLLTSDFFSIFSTDSPIAELNLAKLSDLIAREARREELTEAEATTLRDLRAEVAHALPLGSSEVQRLVEEAVFAYLQQRRGKRATQLDKLKTETRDLILKALETY